MQAPAGSQNLRLASADEASISAQAPLGFLHADRTRIVDADGNALQLRGVNLGGWLLWEAWIWEGDINVFNLPAQAETNIRKQLAALVGLQEYRAFEAAFYDNFIREADIEAVAAHGFNTVRILFNYRLLEDDTAPGRYKARGWEVLDRLVDRLEKHRVYGVLSMASAPGASRTCSRPIPAPSRCGIRRNNRNERSLSGAPLRSDIETARGLRHTTC
ncbi:MAG: hypothetical protein ABI612_26890 [Betaproteobacteria bacterium]